MTTSMAKRFALWVLNMEVSGSIWEVTFSELVNLDVLGSAPKQKLIAPVQQIPYFETTLLECLFGTYLIDVRLFDVITGMML